MDKNANSPNNDLLESALSYASDGWYVFPVGKNEDKDPLTTHGHLDATIDPVQITKWWTDNPSANIGVYLRKSGLIAVDVDVSDGKQGDIEIAELERTLGPLPRTVHQRSGSGGEHILMCNPAPADDGWTRTHETGGRCRGKVASAVDIKNNGYLLVEPSASASGSYTWVTRDLTQLSDVPAAWQELLQKPEASGVGADVEAWRESIGTLGDDDETRLWERLYGLKRGQGSKATFQAIKAIFHDYGRSIKDGEMWLRAWNDECGKSYDEPGLERQVERVAQLPMDHARGYAVGASSLLAKLKTPKQAKPLPTIVITTDQQAVTDQAERALAELGSVYVRGRVLVRVVRDHSGTDWLKSPDGTPVIEPLPKERLRELLGMSARWVHLSKKKKKGEIPAMVPPWVVETLLARGQWTFPIIEGVTDSPVLRNGGSIQEVPGYDAATRMIYDPRGVVFPPIPASPTQAEASRALEVLLDPFCDFPFIAPSDRSAVAALILSIIARTAIDGCIPLFMSGAPTPGSGKGLVIDAASIIATGRSAPKMAPCDSDDEMRKRLLAIGLSAPALISIDNVEGSIGSSSLALALTAGEISDRILGGSKQVTVSLRTVWTLTGNNVRLKGDLGRRATPIGIDPQTEFPEDRGGFRYPNLLDHVRAERPKLVVAALTILRAFFAAGCPKHGKPEKGSFEQWDRLVRAATIWAGGEDPEKGVERIREQGDEDLEALQGLLESWEALLGNKDVLLDQVISESLRSVGFNDAQATMRASLKTALSKYCGRNGQLDVIPLGNGLRKITGRLAHGKKLISDKKTKYGRYWRVEATQVPSPGIRVDNPKVTVGDGVFSSISNAVSLINNMPMGNGPVGESVAGRPGNTVTTVTL